MGAGWEGGAGRGKAPPGGTTARGLANISREPVGIETEAAELMTLVFAQWFPSPKTHADRPARAPPVAAFSLMALVRQILLRVLVGRLSPSVTFLYQQRNC
jgi:hypothetical protein